MYTVEKVTDFSFPSRDVTDQTLPGAEKNDNLFYSVGTVGRVVARIKGCLGCKRM
jgi:hypothetical protein